MEGQELMGRNGGSRGEGEEWRVTMVGVNCDQRGKQVSKQLQNKQTSLYSSHIRTCMIMLLQHYMILKMAGFSTIEHP